MEAVYSASLANLFHVTGFGGELAPASRENTDGAGGELQPPREEEEDPCVMGMCSVCGAWAGRQLARLGEMPSLGVVLLSYRCCRLDAGLWPG